MEKDELKRIADELMMQNFINAINNPVIFNSLLKEYQIKLLNIVKDYLKRNIDIITEEQTKKTR